MKYINPDCQPKAVHASLWQMHHVFAPDFFQKLPEWYQGTRWNMDRALARLSWPCFPYEHNVDPLQDIGQEMAELVSQALGRPVRYTMAKLFLDLPGSSVPLHTDANTIDIMAQVYLSDTDWPLPGTVFEEPWPHTVKYQYNCGYFSINQDQKLHQSGVVNGVCRNSMGFQLCFDK
jgi:hypothetical protein